MVGAAAAGCNSSNQAATPAAISTTHMPPITRAREKGPMIVGGF
jgi:hypothetical protein